MGEIGRCAVSRAGNGVRSSAATSVTGLEERGGILWIRR
jgi:hypothetical protein